MEWFKEIFNQVSTLFKWWIIVLPWEKGLRIRVGNKVKILSKGIHFRIPYFDSVYVQPIRLTFLHTSPQTLTTNDDKIVSISVIIGYSIIDIFKAYNSVGEVQSTITAMVTDAVSKYTVSHRWNELQSIEAFVFEEAGKKDIGLKIESVSLQNLSQVRAYRVIQDYSWMGDGHKLNQKI